MSVFYTFVKLFFFSGIFIVIMSGIGLLLEETLKIKEKIEKYYSSDYDSDYMTESSETDIKSEEVSQIRKDIEEKKSTEKKN